MKRDSSRISFTSLEASPGAAPAVSGIAASLLSSMSHSVIISVKHAKASFRAEGPKTAQGMWGNGVVRSPSTRPAPYNSTTLAYWKLISSVTPYLLKRTKVVWNTRVSKLRSVKTCQARQPPTLFIARYSRIRWYTVRPAGTRRRLRIYFSFHADNGDGVWIRRQRVML